jgi:hypothetical protein
MECSDVLRPSRRAWLPSRGDTRRCACGFAPSGPGRRPRAGGSSSGPPYRRLRLETIRTSQVPGEPLCPYAVFFDPGRTSDARPVTTRRRGLRYVHNEGSHDNLPFEAQ